MPATRLGSSATAVARYDVAGKDVDAIPDFVRHVALTDESRSDVRQNAEVAVTHMGPPLEVGAGRLSIQTTGNIPLTSDEQFQVQSFVDELSSEYAAQQVLGDALRQYVIIPDMTEPDAQSSCHRFSCAGFVLRAYREAGIELVDRAASLPLVDLEGLIRAYPEQERVLRHPQVRARFGLHGNGPWPAVLAGYVLNALDRDTDAIRAAPHKPQVGDEFFPSQAATP